MEELITYMEITEDEYIINDNENNTITAQRLGEMVFIEKTLRIPDSDNCFVTDSKGYTYKRSILLEQLSRTEIRFIFTLI